jgi:hypothetical protein
MKFDFCSQKIDTILDTRSVGLEHWSYNLGILNKLVNPKIGASPKVILTPEAARLFSKLGLNVLERKDTKFSKNRKISLILREIYSIYLIGKNAIGAKQILILHAHPISLLGASIFARIVGCRIMVCLHNDIIKAFRSRSLEDLTERCIWLLVLKKFAGIEWLTPNRSFQRYIYKISGPFTTSGLPHPVLTYNDYRTVANLIPVELPNFDTGYFGRVDSERGVNVFLNMVDSQPEKRFLIAGRNAGKILPRKNLTTYELPATEIFCNLLLKTESIYIDLSGDIYRVGESGTYWDAIGLRKKMFIGRVSLLYQQRTQTTMCELSTAD